MFFSQPKIVGREKRFFIINCMSRLKSGFLMTKNYVLVASKKPTSVDVFVGIEIKSNTIEEIVL